jgi:hypothetical protein
MWLHAGSSYPLHILQDVSSVSIRAHQREPTQRSSSTLTAAPPPDSSPPSDSFPPHDAAVMPIVARGELWILFHREESLVDVGATVYTRCRAHTAELPLASGTALCEELKGDESAIFAGHAAAKLHGLVPGRSRNMYGHVLTCSRISPVDKAKAEAYNVSKNAIGAATTLPTSAASSANERSTPPTVARRLLSLRRSKAPSAARQTNRSVSSSIVSSASGSSMTRTITVG